MREGKKKTFCRTLYLHVKHEFWELFEINFDVQPVESPFSIKYYMEIDVSSKCSAYK